MWLPGTVPSLQLLHTPPFRPHVPLQAVMSILPSSPPLKWGKRNLLQSLHSSGASSKSWVETSAPLAWHAANIWNWGGRWSLHLAGWQSPAAGMGQRDSPVKHFGETQKKVCQLWCSSVPCCAHPALEQPQGAAALGSPQLGLPWARRCPVPLHRAGLSPLFVEVRCYSCAQNQPWCTCTAQPPFRVIGTSQQPVSSQGTISATPSSFWGHHHLLGTVRLSWHGENASVSLWISPSLL